MILGLGNDVIDIRRIERTLERYGDRFIAAHLHRRRARQVRAPAGPRAASYAKRFAAKEACSKALGTGLRKGVFWRDMGVVNLPSGRPTLRADRRRGARIWQSMTPAGHVARIDLTLTDDFPYAHAIVIISAMPTKETAALIRGSAPTENRRRATRLRSLAERSMTTYFDRWRRAWAGALPGCNADPGDDE